MKQVFIKEDMDQIILDSQTEYFLEKDVKIRKVIINGNNISLDLKSFTLYTKQILIEGNTITVTSGKITNKFTTYDPTILNLLKEIKLLHKDLYIKLAEYCYVSPEKFNFMQTSL